MSDLIYGETLANRFAIDLAPRVALVTGGSRGIGRAAAASGSRRRAPASRSDYPRRDGPRASAVEEIRAAGGEAMALSGRRGRSRGGAPPGSRRRRGVGPARHPVNNAGVWPENPAGSGDLAAWDRAFAVNMRGAFVVTDAAIPHLEKTRGAIVFVSSTAGQRGEAAPFGLRGVEGGVDLLHEVARDGARSARDPRQLRRARLGRDGHERGDARGSCGTAREIESLDPARPRRDRRTTSPGRCCSSCRTSRATCRARSLNVNGGSVLAG